MQGNASRIWEDFISAEKARAACPKAAAISVG